MRMFLTRLGYESRTAVTGDVTQVDLPSGSRSGLAEARRLLSHIDGIAFCEFTDVDVVRHPLVQKIVVAYERRDQIRQQRWEERKANEGAGHDGHGDDDDGYSYDRNRHDGNDHDGNPTGDEERP